ncbi:rhodanese-like domain-containing protein [uncultured Algibacter sp.]|uniref:rhodanese-like domain-containing protein n=1 Tax=uncultured Algibacter sp. TaxID=298659 RepID=UPI00260DD9CA|nr:rhodanese-like domain-containing protein [uncultured Algibacter sp.]
MKNIVASTFFMFSTFGYAQKKLSKLLKQENTESIPYIIVDSLANKESTYVLLDSREKQEYETSHIKDAIFVGYDFFNLDSITKQLPDRNTDIIVYCSLGIRSEDIAEQLKKVGYVNVMNLYGGIFEWKNNDLPVYNMSEKETDSIHTFSKAWSKWLKKGVKVYE